MKHEKEALVKAVMPYGKHGAIFVSDLKLRMENFSALDRQNVICGTNPTSTIMSEWSNFGRAIG